MTKAIVKTEKYKLKVYTERAALRSYFKVRQVRKGTWRMPWLSEAMKDVISCDKPRVGANIP